MSWLFERLSEKTTWLGLVGILSAVGVYMSPDLQNQLVALGIAASGVVAVIVKEKKSK